MNRQAIQTGRRYLQIISDEGTVSRIYKEVSKLYYKRTNNSVETGARHFTKEDRHKQVHENIDAQS